MNESHAILGLGAPSEKRCFSPETCMAAKEAERELAGRPHRQGHYEGGQLQLCISTPKAQTLNPKP